MVDNFIDFATRELAERGYKISPPQILMAEWLERTHNYDKRLVLSFRNTCKTTMLGLYYNYNGGQSIRYIPSTPYVAEEAFGNWAYNYAKDVRSIRSDFTDSKVELVICDDIETSRADNRSILKNKFLPKVKDIGARILFVGTPNNTESIYKDIEKSLDSDSVLRMPYHPLYPVVWPEQFDYKYMRRRREEVSEETWKVQYMLDF